MHHKMKVSIAAPYPGSRWSFAGALLPRTSEYAGIHRFISRKIRPEKDHSRKAAFGTMLHFLG